MLVGFLFSCRTRNRNISTNESKNKSSNAIVISNRLLLFGHDKKPNFVRNFVAEIKKRCHKTSLVRFEMQNAYFQKKKSDN